MKNLIILIILSLVCFTGSAQIYRIVADSVKLSKDSCNTELIIENATRHVANGFLFNKGNGRTEFRKMKINDSVYVFGNDTLDLSGAGSKLFWKLLGNSGTTSSNFLGTTDNVALNFRTNNIHRLSISESTVAGSTTFAYINAGQQTNFATNPMSIGVFGKDVSGYTIPLFLAGNVAGMTWSPSGGSNNTQGRMMRFTQWTDSAGPNYNFFDFGIDQSSDFYIGDRGTWSGSGGQSPRKMITISPSDYVGINFDWGAHPTANFHTRGTVRLQDLANNDSLTKVVMADNNNYLYTKSISSLTSNKWSLTGNAGTNSSTNFLGTTDNSALVFRVNNTERMRIRQDGSGLDGYVGIGTNNPSSNLHIYGLNPTLYLEGDSNSYFSGVAVKSHGNRIGKLDPYGISTSWIGGMYIHTSTANGHSSVGASPVGVKTTSTDSTTITHQVVGARGQTADIFDVAEDVSGIPGAIYPSSLFTVRNNGKLVFSNYKNSSGEDSILSTDINGVVKLRPIGSLVSSNAWSLTGNSGTNPPTNFLGTTDSAKLVFKTFNTQRASIFANGVVNIARTDTTTRPVFRFYPNGDFAAGATNDYTTNQFDYKNGIRYNKKLGILEVGVSNNIDTTLAGAPAAFEPSGLIVNSDTHNTINGFLNSSIIAGDGITLAAGKALQWSIVNGELHYLGGSINKSHINGWNNQVYSNDMRSSLITGDANRIDSTFIGNLINGVANRDYDSSYTTLVTGAYNRFSGVSQLVAGINLISRSWASTTLGSANVDFASLPRVQSGKPVSLASYPVLAVGNANNYSTTRSNALTVLYNGRTQINTTGYDVTLTESDVTPKAALEIVSKNSGILIPKLTTAQRDSIASGDKHNGLLLYNTSINKFQYYNSTNWKTIPDTSMANIDSTLKYQNEVLGVKVDTVLSYFTRDYRSKYAEIHEEFWNGVNELGSDWSGSGSTVGGTPTTEVNHPGLVQLVTGSQSNGRASVMSYNWPVYLGSGQCYYETQVNIGNLSTSGQRYQLVCGLFSSYTGATQSAGTFFLYDEGGNSTGSTAASYWQTCTGNGGTRTYNTSLTQTTVATGWAKLRIYLDYVSNTASFYVNGTLVSTHTANLPSATDMNFGVALFKSAGTTSRTVKIDYISLQRHFATAR